MKVSTMPRTTNQRIVVYGGPKSGKTELVARLSEVFNLVWFDLENGHSPMFKLPTEWQERIELIPIPDTKAYPIATETIDKVLKPGSDLKICHKHGKSACPHCMKEWNAAPPESKPDLFTPVNLSLLAGKQDTIVVIDSLTQLSNSVMNWLTRAAKEGDEYKPDWGDYRNQGTVLDRYLSEIQQAPYNIVCITHEAEVEMEDGKQKLVPVAGTRNFSRNTAKYFDHVVYCQVKNKKHNFGSSTTYETAALTGSRTDMMIEGMEVPSLLPFFDPVRIADSQKAKAQAQSSAAAGILATLKANIKK